MSTTKNELLKMIDNAINLEEKSILIYKKHLDTALFWSGLQKEKQSRLRKSLNTLAKESGKHFAKLNTLKEAIKKEEKDVY